MSSGGASPLRRSLWPLSFCYRLATEWRNWCYRAGWKRIEKLDVPVVSVGNLTVGGTGKTPLVVWLVAEARRLGRRPGVLARGYGRAAGAALNDEGELLAGRFPDLPQVQDPDRVAGGRRLLAEHDVDLVILDDGFQHRRLHRDTDIVCLDAAEPFAQGNVLPAGDLREGPRTALQRADCLVLTRTSRLGGTAEAAARAKQLREYAGRELPVFATNHAPSGLVGLHGGGAARNVGELAGRRVVLLSAIAKPSAFRATCDGLGADVVAEQIHRDHHRFTAADAASATALAREHDAALLTTEKDAVKLRAFELEADVLTIDLEWLGEPPRAEEVGIDG